MSASAHKLCSEPSPSLETGDTVITATRTLILDQEEDMGAVRERVAGDGGEDAQDKETLVGDQ